MKVTHTIPGNSQPDMNGTYLNPKFIKNRLFVIPAQEGVAKVPSPLAGEG
jgi:hypothetical protein